MTRASDPPRDPAPAGEWLFEKEGRIYGPVPGDTLVDLLYRGEVDARTPVAQGERAYRPAGEVAAILIHVRKAEARLRVEREVTSARILARRRQRSRVASVAVLGAVAVGAAGWAAFRLAREVPAEARSALLQDFGGGIAIAEPARVGGGRRATEAEEVEIPPPGAASAPPRPRASAAGPSPSRGGMVESNWDAAHIQAVVAREQRSLVPCVRAEAERARDWSGEIPIEFAVGNDGRVARLWIDGQRKSSPELRGCLEATLQRWSFRPFAGERPVVSLSFRVGAR